MDFSQWYSGDMTPPMAAGSQLVPAPRKGLLAALETSWQEPRLKGLAALLLASNAAKNGAEGGKAKQHAWQPVDGGAPGGGGWGNTEWQPPGAILPIQFGSGGQVRFAIPQMLNSLISGVTLPGDVMAGRVNMSGSPTQWDPEAFGRAVDFTTSVGIGGAPIPKPSGALTMGAKTLAEVEKLAADNGVKLHVSERPSGLVLSAIVVPKEMRGNGVGTKIMSALSEYADEVGKPIAATPSVDLGASSLSSLRRFYERLGFVNNKGKNKDFQFSETMLRPPSTKAQFNQSLLDALAKGKPNGL